MSEAQPRPRQAIAAVVAIVAGSLLTVLLSYDGIANLHTLKTQTTLKNALGDHPPVSVATMTAIMHGANLVSGACAAAALVLAVYVWRRQQSARVALSVIAPIIFVSGLLAGNFFVSLVAAAAATLWLQPTRGWFEGRTPQARTAGSPWAAPAPAPSARPVWQPHSGSRTVAAGRPAPVRWAVILTLVFSGLTLVGLGALLGVVLADPSPLLTEMHRLQPDATITEGQLLTTMKVTVALFIAWAAAAAVAAIFVWRGSQVARILLMVSSAASGLLCLLLSVLGGVVAAPLVGASVAVLALLARPESSAWFRR